MKKKKPELDGAMLSGPLGGADVVRSAKNRARREATLAEAAKRLEQGTGRRTIGPGPRSKKT